MDFTMHQTIKIIAVLVVGIIIMGAIYQLDSINESKEQVQAIADINQRNREETAKIKNSFY